MMGAMTRQDVVDGIWDQRNSSLKVSFRNANMSGSRLDNLDFTGIPLFEVNIRRANLRDTVLHDVVLRNADAREADFSGADLRGADFRGADLRGAKLDKANLSGANFHEATLPEDSAILFLTSPHA